MIQALIFFILGLSVSKLYSYDTVYKNYAQKNKQDIAVLIVAYNRPEYFLACIQSLEKNKEAQNIPFIFALDGGSQSSQKENLEIIKKAKLKHKIILLRPRNYGCPKNHIDAYRFIFDWCTFKKMIMVQEDILVTPTYINFILNLHRWATSTYTNIGAVHGFSYCFLSAEEKQAKQTLIAEDNIYWLFRTFCMDSHAFHKIRSIMYAYEHFIDQIPHANEYAKMRSKPGLWDGADTIRAWMKNLIQKRTHKKNNLLCLNSSYVNMFRSEFLSRSAYVNEDNIMAFSFFMHDLVKLRSIVNRVVTIGKYGISENSFSEVDSLDNKIILDILKNDEMLTIFDLNNDTHFFIDNMIMDESGKALINSKANQFFFDILNKTY